MERKVLGKNKNQKEQKDEKAKKRVGADRGRFLTDTPSYDFLFFFIRYRGQSSCRDPMHP